MNPVWGVFLLLCRKHRKRKSDWAEYMFEGNRMDQPPPTGYREHDMRWKMQQSAVPIVLLFIILNITISMFFSMLFRVEMLYQTTRGLYGSDAVFFVLPGDVESAGEK